MLHIVQRAMSGEDWGFEVRLADLARFRQFAGFWQRRDPLQLQLLAFAAIPLGGAVAMVAYELPPINQTWTIQGDPASNNRPLPITFNF